MARDVSIERLNEPYKARPILHNRRNNVILLANNNDRVARISRVTGRIKYVPRTRTRVGDAREDDWLFSFLRTAGGVPVARTVALANAPLRIYV